MLKKFLDEQQFIHIIINAANSENTNGFLFCVDL